MSEVLVKVEEFKDSPVGRIPKDWKIGKLSDLAINLDAKRIPLKQSDRDKMEGIYPYYGASGIIDWVDSYIFEGDYVLLGEDGENVVSRQLPLAFRASGKFWVNNHAHIYEPLPDVDIQFLTILLEYTDYSSLVSGSAQPKLTQEALNRLYFRIPPLKEQKSIAEILGTVDDAIAHTSSLITKLKQLKAGLLHDLLTRGLDENGQLRDPEAHPEEFKDSVLGRIPKEWDVTTIGEQAYISSGSTPSRSNPRYWLDGTIAWVKTGEVDYTVIKDAEEKVTQKALNETSLTIYPVGTVLVAMYGQGVTRGKVGILGIEATTNQACAAIIPKDSNLIAQYLFHYLSYYYEDIRSISHGSNQSNLSEKLISSFPIKSPPTKEQLRFVEIIDTHDIRIRKEEAYLNKLILQKQGLMHDLLTGKVRVNC